MTGLETVGSVSAILSIALLAKNVFDLIVQVKRERREVVSLAAEIAKRAHGLKNLWEVNRELLDSTGLSTCLNDLVGEMEGVLHFYGSTEGRRASKGLLKAKALIKVKGICKVKGLWKSVMQAGHVEAKLRTINERISRAHEDWQDRIQLANLQLSSTIHSTQTQMQAQLESVAELLHQLQGLRQVSQYKTTSIYSQDDKNQVFVRITESAAVFNILSPNSTRLELRQIEVSLQQYKNMTEQSPTTLHFTTESGEQWQFEKTVHTVGGLLNECELLLQRVISRQKIPTATVVRSLRQLAFVLQLLELEDASISAGQCACQLGRLYAQHHPDFRAELANTLVAIADLCRTNFKNAKTLYQEAFDIRTALCSERPTLEYRVALGELFRSTGLTAAMQSKFHDARLWLEDAISVFQRLYRDELSYDHGVRLMKSLNVLASIISRLSPMDPLASKTYLQAIHIGERLVEQFPENDHQFLIIVMHNLGECYNQGGKSVMAIPWLEKAYPLQEARVVASFSREKINFFALIIEGLATAYIRIGQPVIALRFAEDCVAIRREALLDDPKFHRQHMGRVLGVQSEVYRGLGRDDEALEVLVEAVVLTRQMMELELSTNKEMLLELVDDLSILLDKREAPLEEWNVVFDSILFCDSL